MIVIAFEEFEWAMGVFQGRLGGDDRTGMQVGVFLLLGVFVFLFVFVFAFPGRACMDILHILVLACL